MERDRSGSRFIREPKTAWERHEYLNLVLPFAVPVSELQCIFSALRKCCKASTVELLRRLLSETLGTNNFLNRCCLLFSSMGLENLNVVEDVVSVLEVCLSNRE